MKLTHIVSAAEAGLTLHQLLRGPLELSGRQTRIVKQKGAVTVNAAPFFSNQPLECGMVVEVELSGFETDPSRLPHDDTHDVEVLLEDEALIAVYKPALLQCHPSSSAPNASDTLERRVSAYLGQSVHPVHRLDAETTGIVLFAKLPHVQALLQRQMQQGTFCKTYQAWVFGAPEPLQGVIDAPIGREQPDSFTRIVREDGQRAISRYQTLQTLSLPNERRISLLELTPVTGRTHQLRVHMTHIGCPLLGDTRYSTAEADHLSASLGLSHHQLAAIRLCFLHPLTGRPCDIFCPPRFDPVP